ncbi:MAG TPA: family 78 glycoside hydrolase catalytic domain, partial [Phycisphaerae bacterium]
DQGDLWDSGKVASDATLQAEYAGKGLAAREHAFWKVKIWDGKGLESAWSEPAAFSVGLLAAGDWQAKWIAFPNDDADKKTEPSPCFRKEFTLSKQVTRATMSICGLGQYELTLNGQKVGVPVVGPAWTTFSKSCDYDTLDVTGQLKAGGNALGIMLGNGMYNVLEFKNAAGQRLRYSKFAGSMGVPKAIAQLEIEYADGTRQTVVTDGTWKTSRGPVTFSHAYGGEDYDARLEMPGWNSAGFADGSWRAAAEVSGPGEGKAVLTPAMAPPIKVEKSYPPVKVTHPQTAMWVYDFGQNLSGWPEIKVSGPAGTTVKMTPGELLATNGTVSQATFHGPTWLSYTLKGGGEETWHPRFATLGYRYVAVEGAAPANEAEAGAARVLEISSKFVHGDVSQVGTFSSSDETLNRIHDLINAAILSNTQSVLTDCPHREKLGWLEQSHLMSDAIGMNYDVAALYTKICRDMRDAQMENGLVPNIAPEYTRFKDGFLDSPEWGSAMVIDPWFVYQTYGDTRLLSQQYDAMKRYVAYLGTKSSGDLLNHGLGDWYDIGPKKPGVAQLTTISLTSTATYYQDIEIMRKVAGILHHEADAREYAGLSAKVRGAFDGKFFDGATGEYEKGSQTADAMPLAVGLVDEGKRGAVVGKLIDAVKANGYRVTAGDVGFSYVVRALTEADRGDVMLRMMLQSDGPGYVEQLKKGATSLTEAWDAASGSSQNHLMLGHAEAWLYRGLAGIRNLDEGSGTAFKRFKVEPQIVGEVMSAEGDYHSPRGMIRSSWKLDALRQHLQLQVTVPANTTARVMVPGTDDKNVRESGKIAREAAGVHLVGVQNGRVVMDVGSGEYLFESTLPG